MKNKTYTQTHTIWSYCIICITFFSVQRKPRKRIRVVEQPPCPDFSLFAEISLFTGLFFLLHIFTLFNMSSFSALFNHLANNSYNNNNSMSNEINPEREKQQHISINSRMEMNLFIEIYWKFVFSVNELRIWFANPFRWIYKLNADLFWTNEMQCTWKMLCNFNVWEFHIWDFVLRRTNLLIHVYMLWRKENIFQNSRNNNCHCRSPRILKLISLNWYA